MRNLPTLHRLWPTARFVHLIRDGRDVFLSMINWKRANRAVGRFAAWTRDPVSASAFWWKWHVRLGREAAAGWVRTCIAKCYEALVADPAGECAKLCTFLGVPYADTMLEFHEGRTKTKPGLDAKRAATHHQWAEGLEI